MADVSGPLSTLPGSRHRLPNGSTCDDCGKPAVIRMQGETDSFGAEFMDLCQACHDKTMAEVPWYRSPDARCDWCKKAGGESGLRPTRDFDEGSCGPVYYVCLNCLRRMNEQIKEELAEFDRRRNRRY